MLTGVLASLQVYAAQLAWLAAQSFSDIGLAYGAYNTRGFKRELVNLEIPEGDAEAREIVTI